MAGQLTITASIDPHGPIFDGQAEAAIEEYTRAARQAIADRGAELLRAFPGMDKTGRARGGFQANIKIVDKGAFLRIPAPTIKGITWGPWLEGVSERNQSTGFRGYHPFRKVRGQLDHEAQDIAEAKLQEYLPQIGGR